MGDNYKIPLVVLTGATAVGKTDLSISLAENIGGEIISADSIQVYMGLDIGSAKIEDWEKKGIRHHLIDILGPFDEFNVYLFKEMAKEKIIEIYDRGHVPIIVGGTGFYIQAVLYDVDFKENEGDTVYRKELEVILNSKGAQCLHDMLFKCDPESAEAIHVNNVKRVMRALEFYHETGMKLSEHNKEQHENVSPYNFKYFVLDDDRDVLYDRINRRVDIMFENGFEDEINTLWKMGCNKDTFSMQGIGYREMMSYKAGDISLDEAKELIKLNSRHFAKRQLTWFRREKCVEWLKYPEFDNDKGRMLAEMVCRCRKAGIVKLKDSTGSSNGEK